MNELSPFSSRSIEIFFVEAFLQDSFLLVCVLLPVVVVAGCMFRQNHSARIAHGFFQTFTQCLARAFLDIALIVGISGLSIGVVAMINITDPLSADYESNVAVALLPLVWGGLFVGIGFFLKNDRIQINTRVSGRSAFLSSLLFLFTIQFLILTTEFSRAVRFELYNPFASAALAPYVAVFIGCSCFMRFNGKSWVVSLTDGNLIATIGGLAMGIVLWFQSGGGYEDGRNAIYVCAFTLLWGAIVYVLLYIISLYLGQNEKSNYQIKTWHLSESTVFFIFLLYAPVSATEWKRESQDQAAFQAQHDLQKEQIIELKAQLNALIEKNTLQLPTKAEVLIGTDLLRGLDSES